MARERCPIRPARPEDAEALIGMMRVAGGMQRRLIVRKPNLR
jgi:hypothetical protein